MKSYLRFLSRNKLYTVIMAVGLSVALAFVIPLISHYTEIARISKGHENYENIYNISCDRVQASSPGFGAYLKERVPEVERVTSPVLTNIPSLIDNKTERVIHYVDKEFFYFFPCHFIEGGPEFLDIKDAVAVSKEFADFLDPEGSVIGMEINTGWKKMVIKAVFDEYGSGVLQDCDILQHNNTTIADAFYDLPLRTRGSMTIFSVNELADITDVKGKIIEAAKEYWGAKETAYKEWMYDIIRYDEMTTSSTAYMGIRSNDKTAQTILGILCLILFSIPLLNYINLNIALTGKRAREMAMRKLNGAGCRSILFKYCCESLIFTTVCFALGLLLSKLTTKELTSFIMNSNLGQNQIMVTWSAANILIFIGLIIVTGLICGIVPAVLVSRFTPLDVTKGDFRYHSKKRLSRCFIGFQTLLSVLLVGVTLLMEYAYSNMKKVEYNCDIEDVFWFQPERDMFKTEELMNRLKMMPEVLEIGFSNAIPGAAQFGMDAGSDGVQVMYGCITCDEDAFDVFGFDILSQADPESRLGIWLTPIAEQRINEHPGLFEKIHYINRLGVRNIAGTIQNFPVSSGGAIDMYMPIVIVLPAEQIGFKGLAIKTVSDHKTARRLIAEAYEEISGEQVDDIMNYEFASQYVKETHLERLEPYKAMLSLLRMILILVITMTMMGLTGISVYFATERRQEIAIRKVFGGTIDSETVRNVASYLRITLIADIIALPLLHIIFKNLRDMPIASDVENISWIYVAAFLTSFIISLFAVLWQILRAARTNPAEVLKKE